MGSKAYSKMAGHPSVARRHCPAVLLALGRLRILVRAQRHLPESITSLDFLPRGYHRTFEHPARPVMERGVLGDGQMFDRSQRYQAAPNGRTVVRDLVVGKAASPDNLVGESVIRSCCPVETALTDRIPSAPMTRSAKADVPSSKFSRTPPADCWTRPTSRFFSWMICERTRVLSASCKTVLRTRVS